MIKENLFSLKIEELYLLISKLQSEVSNLENPENILLEKLEKYIACQPFLEQVFDNQYANNIVLGDDDWKVLLENSKLPPKIKNLVSSFLTKNEGYSKPKDFVLMIEQFYVHRYSNHNKYLGELNLGIDIKLEKYQTYLEKAVEYTLQQKGTEAKPEDLSANLIMLLKGRIRIEDSSKGTVIETKPFNSSQINLSFDSNDIKLPTLTKKLNAIPFIKKWKFGIEDSSLSFSATFVAAYKENKAVKINLGKIEDNFSAAIDVFKTNIKASFTKVDFGLAAAGTDIKASFDLGELGVFDLGFKVADFSTSIKKGLSFTPIQIYGKLNLSSETHKKWFEKYEELMKLTTFKLEISVKIKTSIGLKPDVGFNKKIESKVAKIIAAQEKIVTTQQTEYLKKQKTFNSLIEKKEKINKLQQETKALGRLIKKEKNPTKKRKLIIQKGKRYIYI
jgi:hypothetical protein